MTPDQYRREGAEAMREAAAKITEGGYRCMSCGQVFLNDNGHSDADCSQGYSNWDNATDAQKAAAIRAIDVDEVLVRMVPAPDPVARLVEAGIAEYLLEPPFQTELERMGRKATARGMMVRLGIYEKFKEALAAMEPDHDRT